ncbi:glycosyltransferase family 1 protein [Pseudomonas indoloxydans]|uniref:Glycosyltransferase family 1 protein n=1 Tax=Ectopseudomonas oleovorans TaxID=301 RepID=A0A2T5PLH5_ECTOL|nr:glycosyltransferase family 1 protein [Pseudomonas indoloxydans]PTU78580.1 glycosyltransferase family 1 protein [Pseudomonas indoloxydans]
MKVVVSVESVRFPLTGIGRYAFELARSLQNNSLVSELVFFSGTRALSSLSSPGRDAGGGYALKKVIQKSYLAVELYRLVMPLLRARSLRGFSDHVYHGTNFFVPPFPGKSLATFHDLSPFTLSHFHPAQRNRYVQKEMINSLSRVSNLIAVSEFGRQEISSYFSWPIDKINTVSLASSGFFRPRMAGEIFQDLLKYGLSPGLYSLYVGTIEPRKNIETLLDAYGRLPLDLRQRWPLILSGYQGWRSESIHKRIEVAQREGWARYLGFVANEDLPALYSGARLFAFPSLYEGFGLPILEALSSGIPVVCSNSSSLPEVSGGAALMCDPLDVDSLTVNLQRALEDEVWRTTAIQEGLRHAATFSWQRCARETVEVYRKVMNS